MNNSVLIHGTCAIPRTTFIEHAPYPARQAYASGNMYTGLFYPGTGPAAGSVPAAGAADAADCNILNLPLGRARASLSARRALLVLYKIALAAASRRSAALSSTTPAAPGAHTPRAPRPARAQVRQHRVPRGSPCPPSLPLLDPLHPCRLLNCHTLPPQSLPPPQLP